MALDATPSGTSSNAYCDREFADAYFENRLNSIDWFNSNPDSEVALITATSMLETKQYAGRKTIWTQALKWPRSGLWNDDNIPYDWTVTPTKVKQACCELALYLIQNPGIEGAIGLEGFKAIQLDQGIRFEFLAGGSTRLPAQVSRLLSEFLLGDQPRILRA